MAGQGGRSRGPPNDRRRRHAHWPSWFAPDDLPKIDKLADDYVRDAAALEIVRLRELARVYHAYEAELARRGALDFGEQIALVARLFRTRPNVLRRWQRQFRYILVDEFQDANVAQIELIELLGRTPDRPDNVMVVGDDDQSIYRFRGASFAAFAEFDSGSRGRRRTTARRAPASRAADRAELPLRRPRPDRRQPADRRQRDPLRARQAPVDRARGRPPDRAPRLREPRGRGGRDRRRDPGADGGGDRPKARATSPSCIASTGTATPSSSGCATRTSRTPSSAACRCSRRRRSGTSSRACGRSRTPRTTSRSCA